MKRLTDANYDIIGYPRLVRLNPNIPWKTRGNGAISIQVGVGKGPKIKVGEMDGVDIFCYPEDSSDGLKSDNIWEIIEQTVNEQARLDDDNTNSGFVLLGDQPPFENYEKAVREIINLDDTKILLDSAGAFYRGYKNSRGLIGATASVAWSPARDKTYEFIAYRESRRWGSKRSVNDNSTKQMDKSYLSTFDNYDYKNEHNRLVPNSACPILYGIRGENQNDLLEAKSIIKSEKVDSWLIFETNHGTDDHLQRKKIGDIIPYDSVIVESVVSKNPHTIPGGHVIFSIKDSTGIIDCAAYEPTKEFRQVIRQLVTGDKIVVYGGVRKKPLTVNIEKIEIKNLEKIIEKVENPICPSCSKHMKSKGTGQVFKCVKCGTKSNKPVLKEKKRDIQVGFYEVPVCARRHLSKPLKRMNHKPF